MNTRQRIARRRRSAAGKPPRNKRLIAVLATLGVFGAIVAVTQVSSAATHRQRPRGNGPCPPAATAPATTAPADEGADPTDSAAPDPTDSAAPGPEEGADPSGTPYLDHGARQHPGDGQQTGNSNQSRGRGCTPSNGSSTTAPPSDPGGLDPLGNSCSDSKLPLHDGFQLGERCVGTAFGEVANAEDNPSLLITSAPQRVRVNQPFTLRVSTRNLVRDRFLPAGQGGYYKESGFLNAEGLIRGHFHTACRMLTSTRSAPAPDPVPAFFVATEDGKGGARPDEVTVSVPGLPSTGTAQCASWAGDGSHRVPMMQRANQIPAIDVVRITVTR